MTRRCGQSSKLAANLRRACRSATALAIFAPRDRLVVPALRAGIELARTADLLFRVLDHFLPLGDPADAAGEREQDGKHRGRKTDRLEGDARIKINVRVKLLLDEIGVVERDALEPQGDLKQRVTLGAELVEHLI